MILKKLKKIFKKKPIEKKAKQEEMEKKLGTRWLVLKRELSYPPKRTSES